MHIEKDPEFFMPIYDGDNLEKDVEETETED